MCEICGGYFCIPECPRFVGFYIGKGRIVGCCSRCGQLIYVCEKYVRKNEILFCENCTEN